MNRLEVKFKNFQLQSPLLTASGTAGHSDEIEVLENIQSIKSSIGAFVTKGITLEQRWGNPEFRIAEIRGSILNSIGLQNKGVKKFVEEDIVELLNFDLPIIVNISGNTVDDFGQVAKYLNDNDFSSLISGIEINVSCPNIKKGGVLFGADPKQVESIVKTVKKNLDSHFLVITKLTPNITDITEPARAAINGGTDALSMINTLRGMAIDIDKRKPFLDNISGGLSGPAIKPIGLFMVYECYKKIPECNKREIPIIGIGGISSWRDVLEYIMAGASAVGIGTAWFINPDIFNEIHKSLKRYFNQKNENLEHLIGIAHGK